MAGSLFAPQLIRFVRAWQLSRSDFPAGFWCCSRMTSMPVFVQFGRSRTLFKLNPDTLERTKVADIPTSSLISPSWVHDFPWTENYLIIPDTPLKYDIAVRLLLFRHLWGSGTCAGVALSELST